LPRRRHYCQQRHETRPPGRFRRGLPPCSVASLSGPPMAAVNRGGGQPGALDDVAGGERASSRHRAAGAAPLGGSNRLLTVDELAAYLGVPKRRSTAAGGPVACGGTGSAGTRGSASGTCRSGSGTRRHDHGGHHQALRLRGPGRVPAPVDRDLRIYLSLTRKARRSAAERATCCRVFGLPESRQPRWAFQP
jgi:hypothetical protein